jgi:hypothetical protein
LIETRGLTRVVDAIGLLAGSKALSAADERGLAGVVWKVPAVDVGQQEWPGGSCREE